MNSETGITGKGLKNIGEGLKGLSSLQTIHIDVGRYLDNFCNQILKTRCEEMTDEGLDIFDTGLERLLSLHLSFDT